MRPLTIGERAVRAEAAAARDADPQAAYRWACPLCDVRSQLYIDDEQANEDFVAHLGTHTIQDVVPMLKQTAWLATFALTEHAHE